MLSSALGFTAYTPVPSLRPRHLHTVPATREVLPLAASVAHPVRRYDPNQIQGSSSPPGARFFPLGGCPSLRPPAFYRLGYFLRPRLKPSPESRGSSSTATSGARLSAVFENRAGFARGWVGMELKSVAVVVIVLSLLLLLCRCDFSSNGLAGLVPSTRAPLPDAVSAPPVPPPCSLPPPLDTKPQPQALHPNVSQCEPPQPVVQPVSVSCIASGTCAMKGSSPPRASTGGVTPGGLEAPAAAQQAPRYMRGEDESQQLLTWVRRLATTPSKPPTKVRSAPSLRSL